MKSPAATSPVVTGDWVPSGSNGRRAATPAVGSPARSGLAAFRSQGTRAARGQ